MGSQLGLCILFETLVSVEVGLLIFLSRYYIYMYILFFIMHLDSCLWCIKSISLIFPSLTDYDILFVFCFVLLVLFFFSFLSWKNLDKAIDNKALYDTFSTFGTILSCKIATDSSGQSKGYGFVQFDNEESAKNATDKLNGMLLNDKQVYVGPFIRKQERESSTIKTKFNNVYVKNLLESTTDEDLKNIFGEYGPITSAVVMRDGDGKSKCFGFVNFENADDAAQSVEALNGKKFDDKEWYVGKAQKKTEREVELKGRFEQSVKEAVDKFQGLNLYVKNLDDSVTDEKLKELFSEFGTITSCKVHKMFHVP